MTAKEIVEGIDKALDDHKKRIDQLKVRLRMQMD